MAHLKLYLRQMKKVTIFLTTLPVHTLLKPTKILETLHKTAESTQSVAESTQSVAESTQSAAESTQLADKSTQLTDEEQAFDKPNIIKNRLKELSQHSNKEKLQNIIIELCNLRSFSASELSDLLDKKSKKALVRDYLTPMRKKGLLKVENPKATARNQKYTSS
jgi:septum formation inhibitor MinC